MMRRFNAEKARMKRWRNFRGNCRLLGWRLLKEVFQQGDTEAAEQVFDEVVDKEGRSVALAVYQSGSLAEGRLDYAKAMRQYKKAAVLEDDNPEYLLAVGKMARTVANTGRHWIGLKDC